jgi:hypothetical protein
MNLSTKQGLIYPQTPHPRGELHLGKYAVFLIENWHIAVNQSRLTRQQRYFYLLALKTSKSAI